MQIVPRAVIGTPQPPATRPRLTDRRWLLAHEVGVNTPPNGRYRSADPARVLDDAKAAASFGISSGRPWEYNFMIGLDGRVFEQGGEYQGAHCLNWNAESVGVIFLNATDVKVNAAQVASWWSLRDWMIARGMLTVDHQAVPHYRFRTTLCCGINAEVPGATWNSPTGQGRLGNLIDSLRLRPTPPPPPPTPEPLETDDMAATLWRDSRYLNVFLIGTAPAQNVSPQVFASLRERGVPYVVETHEQLLKTCLYQAGLTAADLVKA